MTRDEAIAELLSIEGRWPEMVKPLDRQIAEAEAKLKAAQAVVADAETRLRAAHVARSAAVTPLDNRRGRLLSDLGGPLQPVELTHAFADVEAVREKQVRQNADFSPEGSKLASARADWCVNTMQSLVDLRLVPDAASAVRKILATLPS